jgi:hypothetical protein
MAVAALAGALWVGVAAHTTTTTGAKAKRAKRMTPATRFEIEVAFGRIGLDANALTAAGFSAEQTGTFMTAAAGSLRTNIDSYRAADASANSAAQDRDRLTRLVTSGLSTEQDRAALDTALTSYASAVVSRQTILDTAYAAGASALNAQPTVGVLDTFRGNHVTWDLPIQFLGDNRGQPDWVALRDAAANDRISANLGIDPDAGEHAILVAAAQTTNAAAALANLPNLADIQAAWATAVGP